LEYEAQEVFDCYYSNYRNRFDGYLKEAWADRHLELDQELRAIGAGQNVRVLDLGCGTGSVSLYAACKLRGRGKVIGVDIDTKRLFCAVERKHVLEREVGFEIDCEFKESNLLSLSSSGKFDLIYIEEALHHMEPRTEVIRKISSLIKPGGVVIVSEVNAYNPLMQLHLFKKRGFQRIKEQIDEQGRRYLYGVERIMTPRIALQLFEKNQLKAKSLRYFRVASSRIGHWADRNSLRIIEMEKRLSRIPFLSRMITVHYNMVFEK
jgi:2-polyprenyl-3-methyl-5-hydroxy-6-metoxy-1,4-benzoquinol methylase